MSARKKLVEGWRETFHSFTLIRNSPLEDKSEDESA